MDVEFPSQLAGCGILLFILILADLVVRGREQTLGKAHEDTLAAMSDLSMLLHQTGDVAEAARVTRAIDERIKAA